MNILAIETSADETAVSILSAEGEFPDATYEVLGNALFSQTDIHKEYGGIFPAVAKREHAKTVLPMLQKALTEAELLHEETSSLDEETKQQLIELFSHEPELAEQAINFFQKYDKPEIQLLCVTEGPGLEPTLWVGINMIKALALVWQLPVVPVNHMNGHIFASLYDTDRDNQLVELTFPALSLLISGGHTELILMKSWKDYEKIGQTRDDAVGEAFDKVARLMGLPYPGGPEIGRLASRARQQNLPPFKSDLPTPMLHSPDLDFSFSGLKTAVRYALEGVTLSETDQMALARDFEDVVVTVLLKKCHKAIEATGATALIVGGGVSASAQIRQQFRLHFIEHCPDLTLHFPMPGLSTDNAVMIALAGHARKDGQLAPQAAFDLIRADGNKSL